MWIPKLAQRNEALSARILAAAAIVFLGYQLWISAAIWERRGNIPPGFDDSYSYIFDIRKVVEYETLLPETAYPPRYSHLKDLSYNYLLASAASLSGIPPAEVYRISFFAGKLVLLLVLLHLLLTLDGDRLVAAGALGALAAFSGGPEFHGFYWVVPSFWLLCTFLFWVSEMAGRVRCRGAVLTLSGLLGGSLHPIGPYLVAPLGLFFVLLRILDRRDPSWPARSRSFFWIASGVLAAALLPAALARLPHFEDIRSAPPHAVIWLGGGWPDLDSEGSAAGDARTVSLFPGLAGVWRTYLRFFLSPFPLILLLGALGLIVRFRRWPLLALFLATLLFTLASTVHPYASRTCLFLWPATLMVLGAAPVLGFREICLRTTRRSFRIALATCAVGALAALFVAWHSYNRTLIEASRRFAGASWNEECAGHLLSRTEGSSRPVYYGSKYSVSTFLSAGLERRGALPLSELTSAAAGLGAGDTLWAVIDDPEDSDLPDAGAKYGSVESLREQGMIVEERDCGVFRVAQVRRP